MGSSWPSYYAAVAGSCSCTHSQLQPMTLPPAWHTVELLWLVPHTGGCSPPIKYRLLPALHCVVVHVAQGTSCWHGLGGTSPILTVTGCYGCGTLINNSDPPSTGSNMSTMQRLLCNSRAAMVCWVQRRLISIKLVVVYSKTQLNGPQTKGRAKDRATPAMLADMQSCNCSTAAWDWILSVKQSQSTAPFEVN